MEDRVPAPDPLVGVIFDRASHPGAGQLSDLVDPLVNGPYFCDESLPLSEALRRPWDRDAHVLQYVVHGSEDEWAFARVRKRSAFLAQLAQQDGFVRVPVLFLDHDLDDGAGNRRSWASEDEPFEWLASLDLGGAPQPTYWYTTLRGSRFVFVLTRPLPPEQAEVAAGEIRRRYREAGVALDDRAADWTHVFRLPDTVREDTGERFAGALVDGGPALDPDALGPLDAAAPDHYAALPPADHGDRPDPERCRALMTGKNGRGMSDWQKTARKMLRGRTAFGVCFEDVEVDLTGGWNDTLLELVGQVVGMTAREEGASPEGVYAVLAPVVEQMEARDETGETDWPGTAWSMACRMWDAERAKMELERQEAERAALEGADLRRALVRQFAEQRPDDVPTDDPEGWLARRMIASDGTRHHVLRRDGTYNVHPVPNSMLIPLIQDLGMQDAIPTREFRGKSFVPREPSAILADHAVPIAGVRCSSRGTGSFIDGEPGRRVLHVPVHRLNPHLSPSFDSRVDEWLRALFGERADVGLEWLAHALDVTGPICALSLWGTSGVGKGMLVQGLAECFEGGAICDGTVLGRFNAALLNSPVVWCDEGVPDLDGGIPFDQRFRQLVTGGNVVVRAMHRDHFNADIYPRLVFTGNHDVTDEIVGSSVLSDEDVRAIEIRLLSLEADFHAADLLRARGGWDYTAGWINGKEPSRYVVARHVLHLYSTRQKALNSTGRLLVEGEMSSTAMRDSQVRTRQGQSVLRALLRMIETPQSRPGLAVSEGNAWATSAGVVDCIDSALALGLDRVSLPHASQILRQFAADREVRHGHGSLPLSNPPEQKRGRWVRLDLEMLLRQAYGYGIPCPRLEQLVLDGGGDVAVRRARRAAEVGAS